MKKEFFLNKEDVQAVKKSLSNIENSALKANAVTVANLDKEGGEANLPWIRFWARIIVTTDPIKNPCDCK